MQYYNHTVVPQLIFGIHYLPLLARSGLDFIGHKRTTVFQSVSKVIESHKSFRSADAFPYIYVLALGPSAGVFNEVYLAGGEEP